MRYSRLFKAQGASLVATVVDFLVTIGGVEILHSWPLLATMLGSAAGGATNFYLGRHHVFHAAAGQRRAQAWRYFVVWLGSMLLNATGFYLCTQALHLNYIYSKIIVSLAVGLGFNYLLQAHFVFKKREAVS